MTLSTLAPYLGDPLRAARLPQDARVVIVGGGIIGCSIAYHLAHAGWRDVVLIERDRLTSGTTWHAAGLMVTFGSTSETSTELRKYSRDLYERLEAETGLATGLKKIGFIEVATDLDRLEEYRRVSTFNRYCGVDVQEIGPEEVKRLFPLARVDDVKAGFYVKDDGVVNPIDVTMALAKGARMQGVTILEQVPATGVLRRGDRVTGVRTPRGDIQAEYVVNCAGMWARQLGELSGVSVPNQAAEHYYLITDDIPGLPQGMPVLEDPSSYTYIRQEVGGLMVGMFEPESAAWRVGGIPEGFSFGEIKPDWDRMAPFLEKAMSRVPCSLEVGVKKLFCGPESFTPDLRPIVGEAPELRNYFVAAGLNSIGILTGGGMGRLVANWIMTGDPGADVTGFNIDRLQVYQRNPEYRRTRVAEILGMVYKCHYPYKPLESARGAKRSPLHDRLAAAGAYFKDVSGWESPDWYAPTPAEARVERHSFKREPWFKYWEEEHRAVREGVGLIDMSFMCKFLVQGRDAGRCLNALCANDVDGPEGVITYTQCLNARGTLEADITVTKLTADRFLVVVTDTQLRHVETLLRRGVPADAHAFVTDVTSGYAQLNVQGPRSRELLQSLTSADLSDAAFPFRAAQEIELGYARPLCVRITYVGELGYELYIPAEQATHVYDRLVAAGRAVGLRHAGLKALASLRMEKGYRDYGHDIDNTDNPYEAGLGFAVRLSKPGGFVGQEAARRHRAAPAARRLAQVLLLDPAPLMFHAEVLRRDGVPAGYVRAASYGHTLGGAVGLAMVEGGGAEVTQEWLDAGAWTAEVNGALYPARLSLRPLYDPDMQRIRS